jgi:hypothetical protein
MATIGDLARDAMYEIGVLAAGETPSADDADLCLRAINRLVDQWSAERLLIYELVRTPFTITANDGTYTIGLSGADIVLPWPTTIDHVSIADTSATTPQEITLSPLNPETWAALPAKTLTSLYPGQWFVEKTYPTASLKLYPVPTSGTLTGYLYTMDPQQEFANLNRSVALPPGYRRLIVKSLACEIAPAFDRESKVPLLMEQAEDAKRIVKASNATPKYLGMDPGAVGRGWGGHYDIYTDT